MLPTDGLLFVKYSALVKSSVVSAANAAIFIGAQQLAYVRGNSAPLADEVAFSTNANDYDFLYTTGSGATSAPQLGLNSGSGDASRGAGSYVAGQAICIEVPAGTYDVSLQFKSTSGSVTAKERKLWVWTEAFA